MRRWDSRSRSVAAVAVAALVVVGVGTSAAWSDGSAPDEAAATPSATSTPSATPTTSPTPTPTPTPKPAPKATPKPTPKPVASKAPAPKPATAGSGVSSSATKAAPAVAKTAAAKKAAAKKSAAAKAAAKKAAAKKAAAKKAAAKKSASTSRASIKAPAKVPSGGLVCRGSGGPGAGEQQVSAIGKAINTYRAKHGLKKLSISRSSTLVQHAKTMATTGGIWHSGHENIVACVSNDSATTMVTAWSKSAPHKAQMLRKDVTHMSVGGAANGSWLFGAVLFT